MTNEQLQVREMMQKYLQDTPDKPEIPSLEVRKRCAKLILEEALETIDSLGLCVDVDSGGYNGILDPEGSLGNGGIFKKIEFIDAFDPNLTEIADGCEDLKIVTEGCLVACGLVDTRLNERGYDGSHGGGEYQQESTIDPLFNEVMRSNNTKFWTREEVELRVESSLHPDDIDPSIIVATDTVGDKNGNTYKSIGRDRFVAKDKDGKFLKSPSYSPPNLAPIIKEMSK